jgi:hypothetical protein
MMSADYRNALARTRAELDARKIAGRDKSRSVILEITTQNERWANLRRRPSSSPPSVRPGSWVSIGPTERRAVIEKRPRTSHRQYSTIACWAQQQAGVGRHPWPTKGVSARPASFGVRAPTAAPGRVRGSGTVASVGLSTARLAAMPGRLSSWA